MEDSWRLDEAYASALERYLARQGEAELLHAYELGRRALQNGCGILDMTTAHFKALPAALESRKGSSEILQVLKQAEKFFAESVSPFEMVFRSFREANKALRHLNVALEDEAKRIAHALHDETGPLLTSLHLVLARVARESPSAVHPQLEEIKELLKEMEERLRSLAHEIRPTILDDLGLVPALEFLAQQMSKRTGVRIRVSGDANRRLPAPVETALYRIVQEALTNVAKHAKAPSARVELQRENGLVRCVIRDEGIGFPASTQPSVDESQRGLGLKGIKERLQSLGGDLLIDSRQGRGTRLLITIPMEDDSCPSEFS